MTEVLSSESAGILDRLWREWAEVGRSLEPTQWKLETRCEGWDVAALYAHVSAGVSGLRALLEKRRLNEPAVHITAAQVMRAVKPSATAAAEIAVKVGEGATRDAESTTPESLVARFDDATEVCKLAGENIAATVEYFGRGPATVGAAVSLRVVEAAVHLIDLQDALKVEKTLSADAVRETERFLLDLLDPIEFLEVATGRSDRSLFPVHS